MKKPKYVPKTGVTAGKRNKQRIEEFLRQHPDATGAEIARSLGLSTPTVYNHLKEYK